MSKFILVIYLFLTCVCQYSSKEPSDGDTPCKQYCVEQFHRHCLRPPNVCGGCLHDYVDPGANIGPATGAVCVAQPSGDRSLHQRSEVDFEETMFDKRNRLQGANSVGKLDVRDVSPSGTTTVAPQAVATQIDSDAAVNQAILIAVVSACCVAALIGIIVAVVCWYRLQRSVKAASEVEYPAYGTMTTSDRPPRLSGDRKLAHSAQMYHYQHQKQQMLELERAKNGVSKSGSEVSSDDEQQDEQYTVYECPGLATTGEMEVRNPLYSESPIPPARPPNNETSPSPLPTTK